MPAYWAMGSSPHFCCIACITHIQMRVMSVGPGSSERPGRHLCTKENPCFKPAEIILHRSRRVGHEEHEDLEQIARYILRSPFSTAKMHLEPGAGSVLYEPK